ncbi:hydrolase [Candidatus Competibacter phosphatis]|uniref:Hydrolase n=1 Tax=Candidatus Competibacter phosphatis TaxID=221280 RepID=A0ABX1TGQ6_9GAMM|nr:hydrolase [Candidatus Competibacter phosphatis]NMQ18553.1 hydrolase [Candidatus Competibacter phosphatis]
MLMKIETSCLLAVDFQERLMPAIHDADRIVANGAWLIQTAQRLNVPVLASEQYPRGLGHTVAAIRERLPAEAFMEKLHFSCAAERDCMRRIDALGRQQIVVIGAEAHVCVLQTALDLRAAGRDVYLVADAVSSRSPRDIELALERMRAEGVRVVSREMVVFEWLHQAGDDRFREISREFLR